MLMHTAGGKKQSRRTSSRTGSASPHACPLRCSSGFAVGSTSLLYQFPLCCGAEQAPEPPAYGLLQPFAYHDLWHSSGVLFPFYSTVNSLFAAVTGIAALPCCPCLKQQKNLASIQPCQH